MNRGSWSQLDRSHSNRFRREDGFAAFNYSLLRDLEHFDVYDSQPVRCYATSPVNSIGLESMTWGLQKLGWVWQLNLSKRYEPLDKVYTDNERYQESNP
jgi:hypothetical protein